MLEKFAIIDISPSEGTIYDTIFKAYIDYSEKI